MRYRVTIQGHHNVGTDAPVVVDAPNEKDAAEQAAAQWGLSREHVRQEGIGVFRYACGWQLISRIVVQPAPRGAVLTVRSEVVEAPSAEVVRVYTEEDLRCAVDAAYEDAARIVMEPRGATPEARDAWTRDVLGLVDRILARAQGLGVAGQAALPEERITAHARGRRVPTTLYEAIDVGVRRSS